MIMKRFLLIFLIIFFAAAQTQQWKIIGLSGNSYPVDLIEDAEKVLFVPAYQIWKHLNLSRSSVGDTIIVRYDKNEVKMLRKSDKYYFNGAQKNFDRSTFYRDASTYCDIVSFCDMMNTLSDLYFDYNVSTKEIRVGKTKTVVVDDVSAVSVISGISGIVVIDPGHGGKDPGATGPGGTDEKDVVLSISLEIKKYLSKYKNVKVFLTRENDTFVTLRKRVEFANDKNADLFVSVHANASETSVSVGGYKMYFLSEAKNEIDEWTEKLENSVIDLEDKSQTSGLESILLSLASSEFIKESQDFSIMLEKSFGKNLKEIEKLHSGVGQANFYVLNGALMPAVLIETAFISNAKEEKLLKDKKFQKETAESVGAAILDFLKKYGGGLGGSR